MRLRKADVENIYWQLGRIGMAMRIVVSRTNRVFVTLLFVSSALFVACNDSIETNSQNDTAIESETAKRTDIPCQPDGSYINSEGWSLPNLYGVKASGTRKERLKDSAGNPLEATIGNFVLDDTFTDEPFRSIGANYGTIKISNVQQFSRNGATFAYLVFAQRTVYDPADRTYSGTGITFFYAFVDRDGDGKFETLLRDAKIVVPEWAVANQR